MTQFRGLAGALVLLVQSLRPSDGLCRAARVLARAQLSLPAAGKA